MHYDRDYRGLTQSYGVDKLNLYGHGFSSHNLQFKFLKIFLRVGPAHKYLVASATICRIDLFEFIDLESRRLEKFIY